MKKIKEMEPGKLNCASPTEKTNTHSGSAVFAIINRLHHDNHAGRPGAITTATTPHIFITFLRSGFTVHATG